MRNFCFVLALFSSSVALATDMPQTQQASAKAATQQGTKVEPPPLHRHPTLLAMLRRSNLIRRNVGLRPQRINPALTKAAQDHANYMASTGDFSHYSNGGYQYRAQKYGFKGGVLENIAAGFGTVDGAFNTWQGSGAHYASIVSGTTEAGFGYAIGPNGGTYWVGVYGSPAQGDEPGEEEGHAEKLAEEAKAKAEKKDPEVQPASATTEVTPKVEATPKAETPADKAPAAGGR